MTEKLLELLRRHAGRWVSMDEIHTRLGVAPTRLHAQLESLRKTGYQVQLTPTAGARLLERGGPLSSEAIETVLNTKRVGRKVLVYQITDSTNNVAWDYVNEPGCDGLAVFAEQQRQGRGRLGRTWQSHPGSSLLCSILLQEGRAVSGQTLTLLAGLSVARAVEQCCDLSLQIKWPNDVMAHGRKLAGTMIEARLQRNRTSYVLGIGINCQQQPEDFEPCLRPNAVSLRELTGATIDRVRLAQLLLREVEYWLYEVQAGQTRHLHQQWLNRCDILNRRFEVVSGGRLFAGRVLDVCPQRGLALQLDDGVVRHFDGSTTTRP